MKKGLAILLALVLLLSAGCSAKQEQPPQTTVPETTAPATEAPETTVPETEPPLPKLETGTVQGDNIPAILCLLNRGDLAEVTGYTDEAHAAVKTDFGSGTMETQLLRFADEETPESWTGYARWNTGFYESYEMGGKAPTTLKTNTKVEVLEELEDCYLVTVDGETGFVAKAQVSKWPIKSSSGGQDGGDISLASWGKVQLLSSITKTGSAQVRVDGAKVVLKYFQLGDTVQIVAEEGFAPELEGYMTILVDGTYAYIPEVWVHRDEDPAFESWDGFAGYDCQLYDNYQLKGKPMKQVSGNTALTVLWTAGEVSIIRVGDTIGYASTDTLHTTPIPAQKDQGNGGGSEWTPPAM